MNIIVRINIGFSTCSNKVLAHDLFDYHRFQMFYKDSLISFLTLNTFFNVIFYGREEAALCQLPRYLISVTGRLDDDVVTKMMT